MTPIVTPARVTFAALILITVSDISPEITKWSGLALAAWIGLYVLGCYVFPYRKCPRCRGMGRFTSGWLGGIRLCQACDGSGLRLRAGRRALNAVRRHRAPR